MNQDRWQKVKGLFEAVVQLPPPDRQQFLDKSCGTDEILRQAVEDLLASDQESTSFLEYPAAQEVASLIIEAETKNFAAGKSFGHYEIIRQIGAGGMGEVYLAKDTKLDRRVAVKILNHEFSRHEQNLQRFIREAKAASALKFLSEEKAALLNRYADNVEAYQLYLKGRYHYLKLRPAEIQTGILYFQQAIEIDPNYALAYVGLAQAYQTLPLAAELSANDFFPQAKKAASRAIEIDDQLAEAHGVLGWLLFWSDWDWNKAENECQRAIKLNPNSADSHEAYAHLLSNTGRHPQSLAEIKYARELDPLNLRINALEGQFLLHAGQIDEALARLQKTLELEPNFWLSHLFAASAYIEKEMYEEAIAEANQAKELSGGSSQAIAFGAYALAKSGNRAEVKTTLEELLKLSKTRYVPPYHIALVYQGLDDRDKTLEWLNRAFEERDPKLAFLKVEPKWNNLRADSRFIDLMRRMNFE